MKELLVNLNAAYLVFYFDIGNRLRFFATRGRTHAPRGANYWEKFPIHQRFWNCRDHVEKEGMTLWWIKE